MVLKRSKMVTLIGLSSIGFVTAIFFGMSQLLNWALTSEARTIGMEWSHHIEIRIPDLPAMKNRDGSLNVYGIPDENDFGTLISDIIAIGNIYQVDFIHANCFCELSFGAFTSAQGEQPVHIDHMDDHDHGHSEQTQAQVQQFHPPSAAATRHLFRKSEPHKAQRLTPADGMQLPINRSFVRSIITEQIHAINIRRDVDDTQPQVFAEVYRPVPVDGETAYVIRVLVDLEQQAARYKTMLLIAGMSILSILSAAFGYPMRLYLVKSKQQAEADKRHRFLAHHDLLTNLYNRNGFQERMPEVLEQYRIEGKSAILLLFDLDNFKEINDYHSHQAGDDLLRTFANALKDALPPASHISRIGGDEFAAIVEIPHGGLQNLTDICNFPTELSIPVKSTAQMAATTVSGGYAVFPDDADNIGTLMQYADLALYAAKTNRDGSIRAYAPIMNSTFMSKVNLRTDFEAALKTGEVVPYYQPLINMASGKVEGFEALARWVLPSGEVLTPAVFWELINDPELSAELGARMLHCILADMQSWQSKGVAFTSVALNVTDGDLRAPNFASHICAELKRFDLHPNTLAIEVTENAIIGPNKKSFINHLTTLHRAGCSVALDDFGTGYSSISQIKDLPVSVVKIDKSFVDDVIKNKTDQAIIHALVALGSAMDFKLVAEGIEHEAQRDVLKNMGILRAQGFYYARPMPASKVADFIAHQNARTPDKIIDLKFG